MNEPMVGVDTVCATGRCAVRLRSCARMASCTGCALRTHGHEPAAAAVRVLLEHDQDRVLAVQGVEYGHGQVGAGLHEQRVLL